MNIFGLRLITEFQARTKNGQPHQKTTGVTKTICTQPGTASKYGRQLGIIPPMAKTKTGKVRIAPIHNRRLMSINSRFGPSSMAATTGSKAMPHFGQLPVRPVALPGAWGRCRGW